MVERPDQIEKHIESTRNQLGDNLQELEEKVKQATDWRTYFERSPWTMMGLAVGGGVLLATMVETTSGVESRAAEPRRFRESATDHPANLVNDTWLTLKGALIGLAGAKVRTLLDETLPGFSDQFEKVQREARPLTAQGRVFDQAGHRM